jgi:hypothetical protein
MKKIPLVMLFVMVLTACQTATPIITPALTNTIAPTSAVSFTSSPKPSITPMPTQTPRRELSPADVGLLIGPEVASFVYKKCYVWTDTHFHAGDIVYFEFGYSPNEYTVYAPIDGTIEFADKISNTVGWEIRVETTFVYQGEAVWYDMVHNDGLVNGISVGSFVRKGEPIARLYTSHNNGRIEKLVDIGIRNGPRGPNPAIESFYPESYINVFPFVEDDLVPRNVKYETCEGDPIP